MNSAEVGEGRAVDLLFDARHIRQSGIGTYIGKQIPLLQEKMAECQLYLAILVDRENAPKVDSRTHLIYSRPAGARMYSLDEQKCWRDAFGRVRPRAVWLPHYPLPLTLLRRRDRHTLLFVTVHDAIHLLPKRISGQGWTRRTYARLMLELDARRSRQIFAASESTADCLRILSHSAPVIVAPHPVDEVWLAPADPYLSPARRPYIVYVGNMQPHKNLPVLLNAFREVVGTIPQKLVIAGGAQNLRTLDAFNLHSSPNWGTPFRSPGRLISVRCGRWLPARTYWSCPRWSKA